MSSNSPNWDDEDDPDFDPSSAEYVEVIDCHECNKSFEVTQGQEVDHCPWCGVDFE